MCANARGSQLCPRGSRERSDFRAWSPTLLTMTKLADHSLTEVLCAFGYLPIAMFIFILFVFVVATSVCGWTKIYIMAGVIPARHTTTNSYPREKTSYAVVLKRGRSCDSPLPPPYRTTPLLHSAVPVLQAGLLAGREGLGDTSRDMDLVTLIT